MLAWGRRGVRRGYRRSSRPLGDEDVGRKRVVAQGGNALPEVGYGIVVTLKRSVAYQSESIRRQTGSDEELTFGMKVRMG